MTTTELKSDLEELDQRLLRIRQFVLSVLHETPYFKNIDFLKLSFDEVITLAQSIIEIEERLGDKARPASSQTFSRRAGQSY